MKLDFDEKKLMNRINYFYDDNDRMPYLICSKDTMNRLDTGSLCIRYDCDSCISGNIVLNGEVISSTTSESQHIPTYRGCKIFNDNSLPFGEMILA